MTSPNGGFAPVTPDARSRIWDYDTCNGDVPCPCDDGRHDVDKDSKVGLAVDQQEVELELVLAWWRPVAKLVIEALGAPQAGYGGSYLKQELRAADGDIPYVVASGKTW